MNRAASGLGCPSEPIEARPCKLLVIYEPVGSFSPHRDTEKAPGAIATLTVSAPASGERSERVVRHRGREIAVEWKHGREGRAEGAVLPLRYNTRRNNPVAGLQQERGTAVSSIPGAGRAQDGAVSSAIATQGAPNRASIGRIVLQDS